ncbi:unnamed protein product [Pieris brassicae]|uniref:DUF5641 domain-containing protein n=1 Tax=Pieris brassicae TaxID=7116 RepID=A0A9P0XBP4_PIEBR|nr:unnamed protein product [Pieris brassicae]
MFWSRWTKEYLFNVLQSGARGGRKPCPEIRGLGWPVGWVVATFSGKDSVTRVVEVQTKVGILKRPTKIIIVLLTESAQDAQGGECAR